MAIGRDENRAIPNRAGNATAVSSPVCFSFRPLMECIDRCVTFLLVITFGLLSSPCVDGLRIETAIIDEPWIRNSDIALSYLEYCQRIAVMGLDIPETP